MLLMDGRMSIKDDRVSITDDSNGSTDNSKIQTVFHTDSSNII